VLNLRLECVLPACYVADFLGNTGERLHAFACVLDAGESGKALRSSAHSTDILYLLKAGEVGRWHRVDAAEVWHWYGGAPLLLEIKEGEKRQSLGLKLA